MTLEVAHRYEKLAPGLASNYMGDGFSLQEPVSGACVMGLSYPVFDFFCCYYYLREGNYVFLFVCLLVAEISRNENFV